MAKLSATNPLTGGKISLAPMNVLSYLLGGVFLFGIIATSQNWANWAGSKVGGAAGLDFSPDAISAKEKTVVDSRMYLG